MQAHSTSLSPPIQSPKTQSNNRAIVCQPCLSAHANREPRRLSERSFQKSITCSRLIQKLSLRGRPYVRNSGFPEEFHSGFCDFCMTRVCALVRFSSGLVDADCGHGRSKAFCVYRIASGIPPLSQWLRTLSGWLCEAVLPVCVSTFGSPRSRSLRS